MLKDSMELGSLFQLVEAYAKRECKRRNHRLSDDLLQESKLAVWLRMRSGRHVSKKILRGIVRRMVVNEARQRFGRMRKPPRIIHLTLKDWQEIGSKKSSPRFDIGNYNEVDRKIARLAFQGRTIVEIAKVLKLSRSATHRRLAKLRPVLQRMIND